MSDFSPAEIAILQRIAAGSPLAAPQTAALRRLGTLSTDAAQGIHGADGTAYGWLYAGTDGVVYVLPFGASGSVPKSAGASSTPTVGGAATMPLPNISPYSPESIGVAIAAAGVTAVTFNNNNPTTNKAWFFPFVIGQTITAAKLFILNGTAVAGNIDLGIYDSTFARLVSTGSTAQAGTSAIQSVDIADTVLTAGLYYLAYAGDTAAGQTFFGVLSQIAAAAMVSAGCFMQTSAFALPSTATPASIDPGVSAALPIFGLSQRTTI